MKVLVACEESQEVCKAFRALGHEAYSCDIQECSGGHPEWHFQQDVTPLLKEKWDLIIAHPPCTYLTVSGNRWFNVERYGEKALQREREREAAADFFMLFVNADCPRIAIENPIGYMNTHYRKADQIIQPYQFGHPVSKSTCLWLKGLPKLQPTKIVEPEIIHSKGKAGGFSGASWCVRDEQGKILRWNDPRTAKARSKTFPGIARAMAEQWGSEPEEYQMNLFERSNNGEQSKEAEHL